MGAALRIRVESWGRKTYNPFGVWYLVQFHFPGDLPNHALQPTFSTGAGDQHAAVDRRACAGPNGTVHEADSRRATGPVSHKPGPGFALHPHVQFLARMGAAGANRGADRIY